MVFQANNQVDGSSMPWFAKQWRVPLNRCIYTAFSYCIFLFYIILYVAEVQKPTILWIDALTAVWIVSYTFRDMGTGAINYTDFDVVTTVLGRFLFGYQIHYTDCPGAFDPFLEGYYSAVGRATGQVVVYSGRGRFKVFF